MNFEPEIDDAALVLDEWEKFRSKANLFAGRKRQRSLL
jgi:hypothetical protein